MGFIKKYSKIYTNAQINATAYAVYEDRLNAEKYGHLPHNAFTIANQNTSCTLYIFLDDMQDQTKPDYVLFPSQQIAVNVEDGVRFTQLFVKNTHASTNVSANEVKIRVSTIEVTS